MTTNSPFELTLNFANKLKQKLDLSGYELHNNYDVVPWKDYTFFSEYFRRAHISIVDARETRSLLMLHCTIFPHINDASPIFGLDIIAGPSRISGAFHDFSATSENEHEMINWFAQQVEFLDWRKPRQLPDWAQSIFTPHVVAAGALSSEVELAQLFALCERTFDYYLDQVGNTVIFRSDFTLPQNNYCINQKKNPHNPRVMQMLGLTEQQAYKYIDTVMFPEIQQ